MFIIHLKYIKPVEEIDIYLEEHNDFLNRHYRSGHFICSGRQKPRVGGIVICKAKDKNEVEGIIKEDPFFKGKVAEYTIIEFQPNKFAEGFEQFV